MMFLLGSLSFKLQVFSSGKKNKRLYIISNIVLTVSLAIYTVVALNLFYNLVNPGRNYFIMSEIVDKTLYYVSFLSSMFSFVHIFIYTFKNSLNKKNRILSIFNQNTYYVYIIHMIVLGVVALLLSPYSINPFFKFIILFLSVFFLSHGIVYGVRATIKNQFPGYVKYTFLIAVAFVSFYVIDKNGNNSEKPVQQSMGLQNKINLHETVLEGDIEKLKKHIAMGADVNFKDPAHGTNPLITAVVFNKKEMVSILLDAGADIDYKDNEGSTPLHAAAFFCRPEIVKMLLDKGADKTIKNKHKATPLETVAQPFNTVKSVYEQFNTSLGPLGLHLDFKYVEETRPKIVNLLK